MRRLLILSSVLCLLMGLAGCHHIAGVCDCDQRWCPSGCCGGSGLAADSGPCAEGCCTADR